MTSGLDVLLSQKYKEMAGYFNIINDANNTILQGNVTFQSKLNVSGNGIFSNTISISENCYIVNNISINNNLFNKNITVNNNFTINNNLTLDNMLVVNTIHANNLTSNNIKVSNNCFIKNKLFVSSTNLIANNIYVNDILNTSMSFIGNTINIGTIHSNIKFFGTTLSIINNNLIINDRTLSLNNNPIDNGNNSGIEIYGNSGIGFIKTNDDATNFIIKTPNDLNYKYLLTLDNNNNLIVNGNGIFKKNLSVASNLFVNGDILFNKEVSILNLNVLNDVNFNNNVTITGNLLVNNDLLLKGNSKLYGNLCVNKDSILLGLIIKSNVFVTDAITLLNNFTCNNSILVYNNLFTNNITVMSNLDILKDIFIYGSDIIINKSLNIFNNCTLNKNININNNLLITNISIIDKNFICNSNISTKNIIFKSNTTIGANKNNYFKIIGKTICPLREFQTNSLAALNDVPLWGFYRTGGIVKIRLDIIPPMITLIGSNPIQITVGSAYIEPGVIVTDNVDGNLLAYIISIRNASSANIILTPRLITMNMSITETNSLLAGTYNITYKTSDITGNEILVTRILNVNI